MEDCLALSRVVNDKPAEAGSLNLLGRFALARGDATGARSLLEESLVQCRALGLQQNTAYLLSQLATVTMMQNDEAAAGAFYEESLALFRQMNDREGMTYSLQRWGSMAAQLGAAVWAARLWGVAETLRDVGSLRGSYLLLVDLTGYEQANYERMVSIVRAQLGEQAFAAAWAEGRVMTPEQVLAIQGLETAPELAISPTSSTKPRARTGLRPQPLLSATAWPDIHTASSDLSSHPQAEWAFLRIVGTPVISKGPAYSEVLPMFQRASSSYTSISDALSESLACTISVQQE